LLNFDLIPAELKADPNWVLWQLEERNGKNTKIPYQANGRKADTTNPETWADYYSVEQASGAFSGIGYVLTESSGIIGIDWDHVRDTERNEEALEEIKSCGSYAELSQSGSGAHVFVKGKIPGERRRTGNLEMYSKSRFFVVTGEHIEGTPHEIKENQEVINRLYNKHFEGTAIVASKSDVAILKQCQTNKKFQKLFAGDISDYDKDESRADLALCSLLVKQTRDKEQIDRLFRRSGLCREKWERKDYRESTIKKALEGVTYQKDSSNKIQIPFDRIGDHILELDHVFTMRDNDEIFLYQNGVYCSKGTEKILGTKIRDLYKQYYADAWLYNNPGVSLDHIPAANQKFVEETLAYIRSYSHVDREEINDDRYINFKNGLFDLSEWKLIDHHQKY
jgi:putative DNA primase/helicase